MRVAEGFILIALLAGCGLRKPLVSVPLPTEVADSSYIDLEPGWRLRAIVPLTKSGRLGAVVGETMSVDSFTGSVAVAAAPDFLGYETQYYSVTKHGNGVRIRFESASATKKDEAIAELHPTIDLFDLPEGARHVRLLFLQRISQADHNMAVLAVKKREELEAATEEVKKHPSACKSQPATFCGFIPAGVAVRPEFKQMINGAIQWVPTR